MSWPNWIRPESMFRYQSNYVQPVLKLCCSFKITGCRYLVESRQPAVACSPSRFSARDFQCRPMGASGTGIHHES